MSDLVNALNQQSRSSGVLDAIAHPNVVNPLAAMAGAAQTANTIYQVRQNQANQAIGDILQQSTDENGNVDYNKAQSLASQAGPVVQTGMQTFLKNNSELRNAQLINAANHQKLLGVSAMTIAKDGSDANVNAVFDNLAASGVPQSEVDRERARWLAMSPQDRQDNAVRVGMSSLDQLHQVIGQTTLENTGNAAVPLTTTQPTARTPGATTQGPGGVRLGPPPGTMQTTFEPEIGPDGKPTGRYNRVDKPLTTAVPSTQGAQPIPPGGAPSPAQPPVSGGSSFPPGYTGRGSPPPPNPALANPAKPQAATSAPASTPTPSPTPAPTPATPSDGVLAAPPQGQPQSIEQDVKQFKDDQANMPNWQTTDQNLGHAIEALKLTTSGRSTESTHNLYSFLMAQGALPPGMEDNVKNYDLFKKYTERVIADLGNAAGTDQGRQLAAMSNAGTSFSTAANMDIMRNDIAKNRQKMAAYMLEDPNGSGAGYGARRAAVSSNTDPRGFVWSLYTPEEQAKILQEVSKDKTADAKLHRAIGMADALHIGTTPGQTPAGPAVRATPPPPPPQGPRADIGQNPLMPPTDYASTAPNALAA